MVRKDLLKKALEVDEGYCEYKKLRLHNSLINKLRKHYKIYEAVQNFYDDEDIEDKEKRMEHLTWQELIGPGIWFATQKEADEQAFDWLKWIKRSSMPKKDRLYIAERDGEIGIYFYGRDYCEDYYFHFVKKEKELLA